MNSFLELNWLARADKYILLPPVVFADIPYAGFFQFPEKKEILIGDKHYPLDRGLIGISEKNSDKIESTIAHEWRHLWQFYQGLTMGDSIWDEGSQLPYREKIINFFITYPLEYDALLFELKKAPCEPALEWREWLIRRNKCRAIQKD